MCNYGVSAAPEGHNLRPGKPRVKFNKGDLKMRIMKRSLALVLTLCLIAGLGLVIYEMFTPGFAVPGITGIALLLASVVLACDTFGQALAMTMLILIVLTVIFVVMLVLVSHGVLDHSFLVNNRRTSTEEGYISNEDMNFFVGREGVTATVLRPAGVADFDGVRLDVVTEGEFIEAGKAVIVSAVQGRRIIVRAL